MQWIDLSPVKVPSLEQQWDSLRKGLGRAILWARSGLLSIDLLQRACLTDQRYDAQCEDVRADWLWELIDASRYQEALRESILSVLCETTDSRAADQLSGLAFHFARQGDDAFCEPLRQLVIGDRFPDEPLLGVTEWLKLDRIDALIAMVRLRGQALSERTWDWHDACLIDKANELLGQAEVTRALTELHDPWVDRFWHAFQLYEARTKATDDGESRRAEMRSRTVNQVLAAAQGPVNGWGWFRLWGILTDDNNLVAVINHLKTIDDKDQIAALLRVFAGRGMQRLDPYLLELAQHASDILRKRAFSALEHYSDPAVREFAWQALREGKWEGIGLLTKNFIERDEPRLLSALVSTDDSDIQHAQQLSLLKVMEENANLDISQLAVIAYFWTPCQICRRSAAELLIDGQVAPDWLVEEIVMDSDARIRALASDSE